MEGERQRDFRVPLISALFCLFVIAGGVFLIIYVYVPDQSKSWYPVVALLLIGSPWIFWLLAYTYAFMKACIRARQDNHAVSSNQPRNIGDDQNAGQNDQTREEGSVASKESEEPLKFTA
ncbi:hypothetical protein DCAR_0414954 [Daucus carota subsp. sativus]|uniref:Uncharacterized protein n=1 Tax=Daucus carota subsp. sativus TaxID=79200 RepID=A0AAF0WW85_DAUCS|nr:PREDICTED: uncharacterized protein LOC108217061 [Daucus carota subsp. sativus]WOG95628.1 hypothetical protein DCAR_0414954 [Daucus carota subsp. sativus]